MKRVYQTPKLEIFEYSAKVNLLQCSGSNDETNESLSGQGNCEDNEYKNWFELGFINNLGHSPRA